MNKRHPVPSPRSPILQVRWMFIDWPAGANDLDALRRATAAGHSADVIHKLDHAQARQAQAQAQRSQAEAAPRPRSRAPQATDRKTAPAAGSPGGTTRVAGPQMPRPWEVESFEYLEQTFKQLTVALAPHAAALQTPGVALPPEVAEASATRNKVNKALRALQQSLTSVDAARAYLVRLSAVGDRMRRLAFAFRDAHDAVNGKAALRVYKVIEAEKTKLSTELAAVPP